MRVLVTQAAMESLTANFDEYLKFTEKKQSGDDGRSLEQLLSDYNQWKVRTAGGLVTTLQVGIVLL